MPIRHVSWIQLAASGSIRKELLNPSTTAQVNQYSAFASRNHTLERLKQTPPASCPNWWTECSLLLEGNGRSDQNAAKEARETGEAWGKTWRGGWGRGRASWRRRRRRGRRRGPARSGRTPAPPPTSSPLVDPASARRQQEWRLVSGTGNGSVSAVLIGNQTFFLGRTNFRHPKTLIIQVLGFGLLQKKLSNQIFSKQKF